MGTTCPVTGVFYDATMYDELVKSHTIDGFGKCSRSRRANHEELVVLIVRRSDPAITGQRNADIGLFTKSSILNLRRY